MSSLKNRIILFIVVLFYCITVVANNTIEIKPEMYQIDNGKKIIVTNQDISEIDINKLNDIRFILLDTSYELKETITSVKVGTQYVLTNKLTNEEYILYFTELPLLNISSENVIVDEPRVLAHFTITESDGTSLSSNIGIEFRGVTSQGYPKKSFRIEFWDGEDDSVTKDVSLLGMRSDDDWNLQAMYNEPLRFRSKTSNDLWREINELSYRNKEAEAINGIRMKYAELFLNGEYRGVYCVSERVDRKQLKLKKYKDGVRGELYKGVGWGASTYTSCPSYDNKLDSWGGFEYDYPDEVGVDWGRLYNHIDFIVNSKDEDFYSQYSSYVDVSNAVDYFIFLNLLRATDNTGKNIYVAKYKENEPYFFVPWDLDGVFGTIWNGSQEDVTDDIRTNGLYMRLWLDNAFKNKVLDKWRSLRNSGVVTEDNLMKEFDKNFDYLNKNAVYEREMLAWEGYTLDLSQIDYMKQWTHNRIAYLDETFKKDLVDIAENNSSSENVRIYPNPTTDNLYLIAKNSTLSELDIYTLDGVLVKSMQLTEYSNTCVSLADIDNGVYILILKGKDFYKTEKVIVKK